ncbi:MAG: alcohol dehydrogenase catalytic domain-containing protein [Desulfobacterales bacterium]|nr:alcohol dehydrogenase catalytic domain-containing protein [Desulfobacterales bacterium]
MKAISYQGVNDVRTIETDEPACRPGHAKIRVRAAGICGTDMAIAAGKHPRARAPLIMGHEFSGEIVQIVPEPGKAPELSVGDRVTAYPLLTCGHCFACTNGAAHVCRTLKLIGIDCDGAFAEYACVPLDLLVKVPGHVDYAAGALIEPLAVGIHAVEMAKDAPMDNAVVLGAGPIGLLTAFALSLKNVRDIIVADINPSRLARAGQMGFRTVNSAEQDLNAVVAENTNGEGAALLFECAGAESAAAQMCGLARSRGTIVMAGVHKDPHAVDLRTLNFREITLVGSRVYTRSDYKAAVGAAAQLPADIIISHSLGIEDAVQGFEFMKHPDGVCKVVFSM